MEPTTDLQIQENIKLWVTHKKNGWKVSRAFSDIVKNSKQNVRSIAEQIEAKREALEGVDPAEIQKALEPFYIVARREERILINAKAIKESGWKPDEE